MSRPLFRPLTDELRVAALLFTSSAIEAAEVVARCTKTRSREDAMEAFDEWWQLARREWDQAVHGYVIRIAKAAWDATIALHHSGLSARMDVDNRKMNRKK